MSNVVRRVADDPLRSEAQIGLFWEALWLANVKRYVLLQEIGHRRHAERVRREVPGEPRALQPPLHHPADVDPGYPVFGERLRLAVRRAEEAALGDLGGLDVLQQECLQVVPHRDLARLAPLLRESERILRPV